MKRIFVPLPDAEARTALISHMLGKHVKGGGTERVLHDAHILARIVHMTQGYSGSDLTAVSQFHLFVIFIVCLPPIHVIRFVKKRQWDRYEKFQQHS